MEILHKQDYVRSDKGRDLRLRDLAPEQEALSEAGEACIAAPGHGALGRGRVPGGRSIRVKLADHKDKKIVADLLGKTSPETVSKFLLSLKPAQLEELAKILKAVLKGLAFVTVKITDFKPSQSTLWGEAELNSTVEEFKAFLTDRASGKVIQIE